MSTTTTTTLAKSISSCSESLKLLKDLDKQLAQANAKADVDLRDARTERDNAIKQSRISQAELGNEKQTVVRYKSSLIQAEQTIEEQTSIISRLHREVSHWKEQARNWQEHFTRVEEERCSLATRLDEILAEQSQTYGPLISAHLFPQIETSISAPTLNQPLTPDLLPDTKKRIVNKSKSQPNSADTATWTPAPRKTEVTSARTSKINSKQTNISSSDSSTYPPTKKKDKSMPDAPPSRLLRRVQAVIHVKSEEEDNGELQPDNHSFANGNNYVPSQARKSKKSLVVFDSDEEDELMLGNTRRNIVSSPNINPPAKKRRLNAAIQQKPSKKD